MIVCSFGCQGTGCRGISVAYTLSLGSCSKIYWAGPEFTRTYLQPVTGAEPRTMLHQDQTLPKLDPPHA